MTVHTLQAPNKNSFSDGKVSRLAFVNGFATIPGVKRVFPQAMAMKMLGFSRPYFYACINDGRIKRVKVKIERDGFSFTRWGVPESEIVRVKKILASGWVRGKRKMPKKK